MSCWDFLRQIKAEPGFLASVSQADLAGGVGPLGVAYPSAKDVLGEAHLS
jgi:hypothetical protein